jgi:hypothetical protein
MMNIQGAKAPAEMTGNVEKFRDLIQKTITEQFMNSQTTLRSGNEFVI